MPTPVCAQAPALGSRAAQQAILSWPTACNAALAPDCIQRGLFPRGGLDEGWCVCVCVGGCSRLPYPGQGLQGTRRAHVCCAAGHPPPAGLHTPHPPYSHAMSIALLAIQVASLCWLAQPPLAPGPVTPLGCSAPPPAYDGASPANCVFTNSPTNIPLPRRAIAPAAQTWPAFTLPSFACSLPRCPGAWHKCATRSARPTACAR